jgi:hypothetical protein
MVAEKKATCGLARGAMTRPMLSCPFPVWQQCEARSQSRRYRMRTSYASAKSRGHSDIILLVEVQVAGSHELGGWAAEVTALDNVHAHVMPNAVGSDPNVPRLPVSGITLQHDSRRTKRERCGLCRRASSVHARTFGCDGIKSSS